KGNETILVWDLGGGTFDVSILEVGDGVFEVKSTNGDTRLGGDDYDHRVVEWLVDQFRRDQGIDLSKDRQAMQRLTEAAEKAKIELSSVVQTNINLPFITADQEGPKHLDYTLTRAKFEELTSDLTDRCIGPFKSAIADAKLDASKIDEIIMVGGSTRMPVIQELVRKLTGKEPNLTVNPDEVVAVGAAIQAGVLAGEVRDVVLLDVTPLSLGLETLGGVMTRLIERNTTIPTKKAQTFTTAEDGQTSVDIHVLQGERPMAQDNKSMGRFRLEGIPAAPRGVPQIEVSFNIDANGIVNVSAKDLGTGKEQAITLTASTNLSKEEVDRMVHDAELQSATDKAKMEEAEVRNSASSLIYSTEKSLKEVGDKLDPQARGDVETALSELKRVSENGTVEEVKPAVDRLQQASYKMAELLYKATAPEGDAAGAGAGAADGANAGQNGSTSAGPPPDDVIDAEFKESQ
ncbi:MAG TPA: molecular chaperone DnaK, partial [Candidatus Tumulicola sp.]